MDVGTVYMSMSAEILRTNAAAARIFGYRDSRALLGLDIRTLFADPMPERDALAMAQSLPVRSLEWRALRQDGSTVWVSTDLFPVSSRDHEPTGWEGLIRDVSKRRLVEDRVRASEASLSSLVESAPDAILRLDENGVILSWNTRADAIFGWSRDEVLGRRAAEIIAPAQVADELQAGFAAMVAADPADYLGRAFGFHSMRHRDGHEIPVDIALAAPQVVDGIRQSSIFIRDVSERRSAEAAIRASTDLLEMALASAPITVATLDPTGTFTFAGGRGLESLGLGPGGVVGRSIWDSPMDRGGTSAGFTPCLAGESLVRDMRFDRRVFREHWAPIRATGAEVTGVALVSIDITERAEAENKLRVRDQQHIAVLRLTREALRGTRTSALVADLIQVVVSTIGGDLGQVLELDSHLDLFRTRAFVGAGMDIESVPLYPGHAANFALTTDIPVVIVEDYDTESRFTEAPYLAAAGVRSSLAVPIKGPGRAYGMLALHCREPRKWSVADAEFLQLTGGVLGVAIERERAEDQRRNLLGQLVDAQELERQRIAADVHDDAVQVMTAVNLRLSVFRGHLLDPEQSALAEELEETVQLSIGRLRSLVFDLTPPALESHGLVAALRSSMREMEQETKTKCTLTGAVAPELGLKTALIAYRIAQEALINVRKHARASAVTVAVESVRAGVGVSIVDDGCGFTLDYEAAPQSGHLGLISMRARAEMAGGWYSIVSSRGAGSRVDFWVPAVENVRPEVLWQTWPT